VHGLEAIKSTEVQVKSVLVATDLSPASETAVRHGIEVARHYRARLCLMHVVSSLGFTMAGPQSSVMASGMARRDLCAIEQRLALLGAISGLKHKVIISEGDIWDELERAVIRESIDIIVVGTHSRTGISKLVLGSVAELIFRGASCPVLTVSPRCPDVAQLNAGETLRPLLFATDFSDESLQALPHAVSLANEQQTQLVLLHMLSDVPKLQGSRWYTAADVGAIRRAARNDAYKSLKDLVSNVDLAIDPLCMAEFGEPAEGILWAARNLRAVAIILGLKRREPRHPISHLPWSMAYKVACGAVCPVLTVRA